MWLGECLGTLTLFALLLFDFFILFTISLTYLLLLNLYPQEPNQSINLANFLFAPHQNLGFFGRSLWLFLVVSHILNHLHN